MSEVYARRLSRVQRDYDASRDAMGYVIRNWEKQNISHDIQETGIEDLRQRCWKHGRYLSDPAVQSV